MNSKVNFKKISMSSRKMFFTDEMHNSIFIFQPSLPSRSNGLLGLTIEPTRITTHSGSTRKSTSGRKFR